MQEVFAMTIGVICDEDACLMHVQPYLSSILPFLAKLLSSTIRSKSSAFYALSKFASYLKDQGEHHNLIMMTLQGIIDKDQNVQESACTCLAVTLQSCQEIEIPIQ